MGDQVDFDAPYRVSIIHKKIAEGLTTVSKPSATDLHFIILQISLQSI
jgi:hypothetical protein